MTFGLLGLAGLPNSAMKRAIRKIAFHELERFDIDQVLETGVAVFERLEVIKQTKPRPLSFVGPSTGLLAVGGDGMIHANDFALALHLSGKDDPVLRELCANGFPALMAYLFIQAVDSAEPGSDFLESGLSYAIQSIDTFASQAKAAKGWERLAIESVERLGPLAKLAHKFKKGRKPDALGPLAIAIRQHLKHFPDDKPKKVWDALACRPPRGMKFRDIRHVGKYIEYEGKASADDTDYKHFQNRVRDQRKLLKGGEKT